MINVIVLLTCFNRADKTLNAINKVRKEKQNISFLVIDDCSTDDTIDSIKKIKDKKITIIKTTGGFYYTKSMRLGMTYLLENNLKFDYLLMINDDVDFYNGFLTFLINESKNKNNSIIVGCTHDNHQKCSYGGIIYKNKYANKLNIIGPSKNKECDTFNANCVLIPYSIFEDVGPYNHHYSHSMGDFDYGFKIKKKNYKIFVSENYVGICNRNALINTWLDKNLKIKERIKKKEHPKGLPFKENFYYFHKNFNLYLAIRCSITPYIRIFLRR